MVILHDLTYMPEILESWKEIGVPGVTILHSIGGFQASELVRKSGLGGFLKMFEEVRSPQRTLFSLIDDQAMLEQAISEADRVVKGFDRPRSGILFTLPIGQVLGLQKWHKGEGSREAELDIQENDEQSKSNLLDWLKRIFQPGMASRLRWTGPKNEICPFHRSWPVRIKSRYLSVWINRCQKYWLPLSPVQNLTSPVWLIMRKD